MATGQQTQKVKAVEHLSEEGKIFEDSPSTVKAGGRDVFNLLGGLREYS